MTRWWLLGGALAAPLFVLAVLAQAATRPGFDLARHPASVLANGDLGWIQTTTFLLCGALTIAGAVGLRRVAAGPAGAGARANGASATRPGRWAPVLLTVTGAGLVGAGIFRLDPLDGFPPGTPAGVPTSMSWHSIAHNAVSTPAFLTMIVACFVLAHRFTAAGQRPWAIAGRVSAGLFIAGLVWALTGGAAGSLTLFLGVIAAWLWISATLLRLAASASALTPIVE
jgi:Protein of unknown function (DUF998)